MNVCTVLDEIERLASEMVNLPQCERAERVRDYTTISVLIHELEELGNIESDIRNSQERLQHLTQNCRILAGISDEISVTEKQAFSQARDILNALRTQFKCDWSQ